MSQTAALDKITKPTINAIDSALEIACQRIAPTWPLDQFIAVNPYWGFFKEPIESAAHKLARCSGATMTMPRMFYRQLWQEGRFNTAHLTEAIKQTDATCTLDMLVSCIEEPAVSAASAATSAVAAKRVPLMTNVIDRRRDLSHNMAWQDFVTHQISQHCAAYFDTHQATWSPKTCGGLYAVWRDHASHDLSSKLLMGYNNFAQNVSILPTNPLEVIAQATQALGIEPSQQEDYFHALLLSVNGWASWCAYQRWQGALVGKANTSRDDIVQLLAVRLAWEWLLLDMDAGNRAQLVAKWATHWHEYNRYYSYDGATATTGPNVAVSLEQEHQQEHDWLLQRALEIAYQTPLCAGLLRPVANTNTQTPSVQAAFCIDVRSEVFRRALEQSGPAVQTIGFAGFFGLPVAYSPIGTAMTRPQLPGLLSPAMTITDEADEPNLAQVISARRRQHLNWRAQWQQFRTTASSGFTFVESLGLAYAGKLLKNNIAREGPAPVVEKSGISSAHLSTLRPRYGATTTSEVEARADMAAGILGAMGLAGKPLARLILLAGHGSQSANNPHAAGLDCGACGGQTGEVNARALAALLNEAPIRAALRARDIEVPDAIYFLAGLHNTTTDDVDLYDLDLLPASHQEDLAWLKRALAEAGIKARGERAKNLGLDQLDIANDATGVARALHKRANNWAEVRPEWALANNAAFIVAPRARTRHLDLAGRTFLHDYDWQQDTSLGVLELIMTAPMIVTNWINMQYYASTVDNQRYGSGNKVLHNVVGGRLGVFEGNGGDLRIGLSMQSLHDGHRWQHTPLRLSVFIEAPQTSIDTIIARHDMVRQLLDNEWLYLFRIAPPTERAHIARYRKGRWIDVDAD